jgi:4-amino-4-deoxy-L-arabinose transferase-like glycosyltransferase
MNDARNAFSNTRQQAAAGVLALMLTTAMLVSIDRLATPDAAQLQMAAAAAASAASGKS